MPISFDPSDLTHLVGLIYLVLSIWTHLGGPVYLDLSNQTSQFGPIYLDYSVKAILFRPIYFAPSILTRKIWRHSFGPFNLDPFTQIPLELFSLKQTPVLLLSISHWHSVTAFGHLLLPMLDSMMT